MSENTLRPTGIGRVLEADGVLVTLQFNENEAPLIFSRLSSDCGPLCVVRRISEKTVQAAAEMPDRIWTPGQEVKDSSEPFSGRISTEIAESMIRETARENDALETGIKVVDLFAPMVKSGSTGIFAEWGLGALVLIPELVLRLDRLGARQTIYVFVLPIRGEQEWRDINAEAPADSKNVDVYYIPVADPITASFVDHFKALDTKLVLSRRMAEQNIWPAIDPLRSGSLARPGDRSQLADKVRELIRQYYALQFSEGLRSLNESDWLTVRRGRLATHFLGQPFFVAEPYTGQPGLQTSVNSAAETFGKVLSGQYDDYRKDAFSMAGDTPKAK